MIVLRWLFKAYSIIFFFCFKTSNAIPIPNGVVGEPIVECTADAIRATFQTQNQFEGRVFVKGYSEVPECRGTDARISNSGYSQSTQEASISVSFLGPCGVRRMRELTPVEGMSVTATVIISFHPLFLTKVDRAYFIKCFFMEALKTVTAELGVSMLTTNLATAGIEMPNCRYEVLSGSPDGPPVRYAQIGDMVFHKWRCDGGTPNQLCMTVHSCTVDDGSGNAVNILDSQGCAQDRYLLQNLDYVGDMMAYREAHIFKYADKPTLYFNCQIRLKVKDDPDLCLRTSDSCAAPAKGKREAINILVHRNLIRRNREEIGDSSNDLSLDVSAERISVAEITENFYGNQENVTSEFVGRNRDVCLSPIQFAMFFSASIALLLISICAFAALIWNYRTLRHALCRCKRFEKESN